LDETDGSKRRNVLKRTGVNVDDKNVKIFRDEKEMILSFAKLVKVRYLLLLKATSKIFGGGTIAVKASASKAK